MPLRSRTPRALLASLCLSSAALSPGCAVFGTSEPSTVAQGKYFSSGNPEYDEFFIQLFQLQVQMADAPGLPDAERQALAQTLGLDAKAPDDAVTHGLHEEALKLVPGGLRMRLEQHALAGDPEMASATLHATYRPKDNAAASLINQVETSANRLLHWAGEMKAAELHLAKLEVEAINLDANVSSAFAEAHPGKRGEVRKNLSDAQKLITLMKARGDDVRRRSDLLLAAISTAVDTDDGSLSAPPEPTPAELSKTPDTSKKGQPKPHAKPRATGSASALAHATTAPAPASKPKPAPRDFEP